MANFRFEIADPKTRKTYGLTVDQEKAVALVGKKIGETFNGSLVGLTGYDLQITGGTDKDGFPMILGIHGPGRKKVVLSGTPGYHPVMKGERKRKTVRGNTISRDIIQINAKVVKEGQKPLSEIVVKKEKTEAPSTEEKKGE